MKSTIVSAAVAMALSVLPIAAHAQEDNVHGGWEEGTGYYTVKSPEDERPVATADGEGDTLPTGPVHNANLQVVTVGGRTYKRMIATTNWPGVRHYTKAFLKRGGVRVSSSRRVVGVGHTKASTKLWDIRRRGDVTGESVYGRI